MKQTQESQESQISVESLMKQANKIYLANFSAETNFERALFFSWYCSIRDCKFCYMSTQPNDNKYQKIGRRTTQSLLAEALLIKHLGWEVGFLSGGKDAYTTEGFLDLVKKLNVVIEEKIWINIGAIKNDELEKLQPYVKGVVGSIETVNKKVHDFVCPSKPIGPYLDMFNDATKLGMKKAITIILGLGETEDDFYVLEKLIKQYDIDKIHFYGLNPHKGTVFEGFSAPTKYYQAWWIAKTRIAFPKIDIQFGIWDDRADRVAFLLNAGANSVSKYPALKAFGTKSAFELEAQCKQANRIFKGTVTKLPKLNWNKLVDELKLDNELKQNIKTKLYQYLKNMGKSIENEYITDCH